MKILFAPAESGKSKKEGTKKITFIYTFLYIKERILITMIAIIISGEGESGEGGVDKSEKLTSS